MKLLFAICISSVTIHLALCDCNITEIRKCGDEYAQKIETEELTKPEICVLAQKMMSCAINTDCLEEDDLTGNINIVKLKMKDNCAGDEISLDPQSSKGEHQTRRSVFSMWIGVMIALVILDK